ncbi:MAG: DUF1275 domain-containing protein [Alphaproteobacteria bacterium]|nr:MAG: DUF1275 domain-containing protein [Alphaproteobacteria bacterium]
MSELLLPSRRRPPTIVPPLLSFTAGFIDSFTVLALFGLFVAQVTGSFVLTAAADPDLPRCGHDDHRHGGYTAAARPRSAAVDIGL